MEISTFKKTRIKKLLQFHCFFILKSEKNIWAKQQKNRWVNFIFEWFGFLWKSVEKYRHVNSHISLYEQKWYFKQDGTKEVRVYKYQKTFWKIIVLYEAKSGKLYEGFGRRRKEKKLAENFFERKRKFDEIKINEYWGKKIWEIKFYTFFYFYMLKRPKIDQNTLTKL